MGQPAAGNKAVVYSITPEQVKEFHHNFYVGSNIVVSGAGALDGAALASAVDSHFSSVPSTRISEVPNSDEPLFTPSLMYQRDD